MIAHIENVEHNGQLGHAKVYENEFEAEQDNIKYYKDKGILICCGGYYNALWFENKPLYAFPNALKRK